MKKAQNKKVASRSAPTSRKVIGVIALAGLFACGLFVGMGVHQLPRVHHNVIRMSAATCDSIARTIAGATDAKLVEELNDTYRDNCAGRVIEHISEPVASDTGNDNDARPVATCARIEQLLSNRLRPEEFDESWAHISNAETYARLVETGCAENADKYRALALREIQIAMALDPVDEMDEDQIEDVIDVYKKIQMQAAAQQMIDKLQKISEPTIDFILKLEKILED